MGSQVKPSFARHRTDTGSAALIELLEASGIGYVALGGCIDGAAYYRGTVALVDWKAKPTSAKTKTQQKLEAKGVPIHFVATAEDVRELVQRMKGAA